MTNRERIEKAFRAYGDVDAETLESHVRGCDLSRAVDDLTLLPRSLLQVGDTFQVWVRDGGTPGKYGSPIGEDPARLGIRIDGRHREIFEVTAKLRVVACIAATFPMGMVHGVGGEGGGTQYILPPNWLSKVKRIS